MWRAYAMVDKFQFIFVFLSPYKTKDKLRHPVAFISCIDFSAFARKR